MIVIGCNIKNFPITVQDLEGILTDWLEDAQTILKNMILEITVFTKKFLNISGRACNFKFKENEKNEGI